MDDNSGLAVEDPYRPPRTDDTQVRISNTNLARAVAFGVVTVLGCSGILLGRRYGQSLFGLVWAAGGLVISWTALGRERFWFRHLTALAIVLTLLVAMISSALVSGRGLDGSHNSWFFVQLVIAAVLGVLAVEFPLMLFLRKRVRLELLTDRLENDRHQSNDLRRFGRLFAVPLVCAIATHFLIPSRYSTRYWELPYIPFMGAISGAVIGLLFVIMVYVTLVMKNRRLAMCLAVALPIGIAALIPFMPIQGSQQEREAAVGGALAIPVAYGLLRLFRCRNINPDE